MHRSASRPVILDVGQIETLRQSQTHNNELSMKNKQIDISERVKLLKSFDDCGNLTQEMYYSGMLDIGLTINYHPDGGCDEFYMWKRKPASKKKYEKERLDFVGMPEASHDSGIEWDKLLKAASSERRENSIRASDVKIDTTAAVEIDMRIRKLIDESLEIDGECKINNHKTILGERTFAQSKKIVSNYKKYGCLKIYGNKIEFSGDFYGVSYLILVLPDELKLNNSLFKYSNRIASQIGHAGSSYCGQKYDLVKLD